MTTHAVVALTHAAVRGALGVWHSGGVGFGPAIAVISKISIVVKQPLEHTHEQYNHAIHVHVHT